jgi:hypothetical protein
MVNWGVKTGEETVVANYKILQVWTKWFIGPFQPMDHILPNNDLEGLLKMQTLVRIILNSNILWYL